MKNKIKFIILFIVISIIYPNLSHANVNNTINKKIELILSANHEKELNSSKYKANSLILTLNSKKLSSSELYFRDRELMIPLREIANAFNYDLSWDSKTKTVILNDKAILVKLTAHDYFYVYGAMAQIRLSLAPEIKNDRMYVPLDFLTEVLKAKVTIENNTISSELTTSFANSALKLHEISKSHLTNFKNEKFNTIKIHIIHIGENTGYVIYECSKSVENKNTRILISRAFDIKNGNNIPLTRAVSKKNIDEFKKVIETYDKTIKINDETNYYLKQINDVLYFSILNINTKGEYYEIQIPFIKISKFLIL